MDLLFSEWMGEGDRVRGEKQGSRHNIKPLNQKSQYLHYPSAFHTGGGEEHWVNKITLLKPSFKKGKMHPLSSLRSFAWDITSCQCVLSSNSF